MGLNWILASESSSTPGRIERDEVGVFPASKGDNDSIQHSGKCFFFVFEATAAILAAIYHVRTICDSCVFFRTGGLSKKTRRPRLR